MSIVRRHGCLDRLLDNLKWMSEKGLFSGTHDAWALEHLGFQLGISSQEA